MGSQRTWSDSRERIPFRNDSGEDVPAFAVMQVVGTILRGSDTFYVIDKPGVSAEQFPGMVMFNGENVVPDGRYGGAVLSPHCLAMASDADGPLSVGESLGAKAGSWYLSPKSKGYRYVALDEGNASYISASIRSVWIEPDGNMLEVVQVTSETPDADGFYDGNVLRYDPIAKSWATLFSCKVIDSDA